MRKALSCEILNMLLMTVTITVMYRRNYMPLIKHFTNAEHLSSIYADGVLKLEGSNIEYIIRNNIEAIHPSGMPVNTLWKAMKMQYKLAGRYVWLTEETDVNCITAQRKFEKIAFVFDAEEIGAQRWTEVAKRIAFKNKKAGRLIKHLNNVARASGDDTTKWWVVRHNVGIDKCIADVPATEMQIAA